MAGDLGDRCLEDAQSLVIELGDAARSFLSRPDVARDVRASMEILREAGRDDDVARFEGLAAPQEA